MTEGVDTTVIAAFAVGFVSFVSPCVLPLVPGYLSAVSGVSLAELQQGERRLSRVLLPAIVFCLAFTVVFVALALTALEVTRSRLFGATAFLALAPLALGSVVLTRFDYWPAALVAAALAAFVLDRPKLGFAVLGLAVTAKIYPLVLLPPALLLVRRRQGSREALLGLACFAAVLALVVVPFLVIDAGGQVGVVAGPQLVEEGGGAPRLVAGEEQLFQRGAAGGVGGLEGLDHHARREGHRRARHPVVTGLRGPGATASGRRR